MGRRISPVERPSQSALNLRPVWTIMTAALTRAIPTLACLVALALLFLASPSVQAQSAKPAADAPPQRMVVEARELIQNEKNDTVTARGNVQIYYKGKILEADKVIYDRKTSRVFAEGKARLTEPNGQITRAERFELTDDLRNGFVDSLTTETKEKTYLSAPRAERSEDTVVFERGTYTACKPCEDAEKPPLWRVRAKRIIEKTDEKTIYYEDASLELLGIPIAYVPFFSVPDPSVKRRSGILSPRYVYKSQIGYGVGIPVFWAVAPNMDLVVTPTVLTGQGFLGEIEWKHRLDSGTYSIRAEGIRQLNPSAFGTPPLGASDRTFRGAISTNGEFAINDKWKFGWDATALSDRYFLQDYRLYNPLYGNFNFRESASTVYLTGKSERSYFDLRGFYFQGLSPRDYQPSLGIAAPMLEYNRTFPIAPSKSFGIGGQFELDVNGLYTKADAALYESILPRTFDSVYGLYSACQNYAPGIVPATGNCLLRGIGGDYARLSAQASWKRQFIDPLGQSWTPFVFARASGTYLNYDTTRVYPVLNATGVPLNNFSQGAFLGADNVARGQLMPGIGLEYRYPLFAKLNFGTVIFEPIVQIISRPSQVIGSQSLVNIDSQSLVFDDTNLFQWNKYSGYDRFETGTRVNYGGQFTLNFNNGGFLNVAAGQSRQIAGQNSYATLDAANVGISSGLDTKASDYVARVAFAPNATLSFVAKGRFDPNTLQPRRVDLIAGLTLGGLTATAQYANYAQQQFIGFDKRRQGMSLGARYDVTSNYWVNGSVSFDMSRYLYNGLTGSAPVLSIASMGLGAGYRDECTTFSINYTSVYQPNALTGLPSRNQTILLSLQLRTLGEAKVGASLASVPVTDGIKQQF